MSSMFALYLETAKIPPTFSQNFTESSNAREWLKAICLEDLGPSQTSVKFTSISSISGDFSIFALDQSTKSPFSLLPVHQDQFL